jgi:NitT/TauT family transport system permease protein
MKPKWYEAPAAAEDTVYWKPKSEGWVWAAAGAIVLTLLANILVPSAYEVNPLPYRILLGAGIAAYIAAWAVGFFRVNFRRKFYHKAQFFFAAGIVLTLWELVTTKGGFLPRAYFPGFTAVINVLWEDRSLLVMHTLYSMRLFFVGLLTGTATGLATGICIGWWRQWDYWLSPVIKITGVIPAVVWMPIALTILPSSFSAGVFLIIISAWFPVSSMMAAGIISTPKSYFEAAKTLGADNRFLLFHVAIPNAMPSLFTGVMTATAFSFTTLVASEMVGAKFGLGYYINWAKGWANYPKVYGAIIIIACEFALILTLLGRIRGAVLRWQRGLLK